MTRTLLSGLLGFLISAVLFVPSLQAQSWSDTLSSGTRESASTAPDAPGRLAFDTSVNTAWRLSQGETFGWLESYEAQPRQIRGVRTLVELPKGTELQFSTLSGGSWVPIAGAVLTGPQSGEVTVKFPERPRSTSILVSLSGSAADQAKVATLEWVASEPVDDFGKVHPQKVTFNQGEYINIKPSRLWDGIAGNTWYEPIWDKPWEVFQTSGTKPTSIFPPYFGNPPKDGEILWDLDGIYRVQTLRAFFLQNNRSIKLEFWDGTKWSQAQTFGAGWSDSGQGWQRIDLSQSVSTNRIRITFPGGWERARFIGELEVWGAGPPLPTEQAMILPSPQSDGSIHFTLERTEPQTATLEITKLGVTTQTLTGRWNNTSWSVTPSTTSGGNSIYNVPLTISSSRTGTQFLTISQGNGVRSVVYRPNIDRGRVDLSWSPDNVPSANKVWLLGKQYSLEKVRLFSSSTTMPVLKIGNGTGKKLVERVVSWKSQGDGWWDADLTGQVAEQISLSSGVPFVIDQFFVWGTPVKDSRLGVEIWWPAAGTNVDASSKDGTSLIGWLGDPKVQTVMNGFHPRQSDKVFWMPLAQMDMEPDQESDIELVSTWDSIVDRQNQHVKWTKNPAGTFDQGVGFQATTQSSFIFSGTVKDSKSRVFVGGVEVPVVGTKWSTIATLTMGYQSIPIVIWDKGKKKIQMVWNKEVFLATGSPLITFDRPAGDLWSAADWTVTGRVGNGVGLKLTMNGNPVGLAGDKFSIPLASSEGPLNLEFLVSDSLGRTGTKILSLKRDHTAPNINILFPKQGQYLRNNSVNLTMDSGIDAPLWWKIETEGWEFDATPGHQKAYTFADGFYHRQVQAQDRAGNLSSVASVDFVVDSTPPKQFILSPNVSGWTTNTSPIVTFATTDETSDIDHYEYKLDGADWRPAASPLTLPHLTDGVHELFVRAFDKAGNTTLSNLTLSVDTTPPVDFTPSANVSGWANNNRPTVSFATTDVTSEIFEYRVSIDGGSWTSQTSPWQTPLLTDGGHSISVEAIDNTGNSTVGSVLNLQIDATVPEEFTAVVNVSGWTSNNRPTFSFDTSDATSGVDRFEMMIGDQWERQFSPYQTPVLTEGRHLILVRAIDRAGNIRGTTPLEVYIDTVVPPAVTDFVAIPSPQDVRVQWIGSGEEGETFRLERVNGQESQVLILDTNEFLDSLVSQGDTVRYRAWAVDRAGNVGNVTNWEEIHIGKEIAPVLDSGVTAQFEGFTVKSDGGSFSSDVSQVVLSTKAVDAETEPAQYPIVGPVYEARVVRIANGGAAEGEHADLSSPVRVSINYDKALIPDGYNESQLKPYYFDPIWYKWLPINGAIVNINDQSVSFETNHFSSFTLQASTATELTPQQLRDVAFSPLGTNKTHGPVSVSTEGGSVSTEFTEYVLPGKNALDLVIKRTWDSGTAQADSSGFTGTQGDAPWRLGSGWRLNFPSLKWNGDGLWIKGPDGQSFSFDQATLKTTQAATGTFVIEVHERVDARAELVVSNGLQSASLFLKDGRTVRYDGQGRVTKITDATGRNAIVFAYKLNLSEAQSITDTLGREVNFSYSGGFITEISVKIPGGEAYDRPVKYVYAGQTLKNATDVGGRVWSYGYDTTTPQLSNSVLLTQHSGTPEGWSYKNPDPVVKTFAALNRVEGPGIGITSVQYSKTVLSYQEQQQQEYQYPYRREDTTWEERMGSNGKKEWVSVTKSSWSTSTATAHYTFTISQERLVPQKITIGLDADHPVRTTHYKFNYQEVAGHQFIVSSSTVNDERLETTSRFSAVPKTRLALSTSPDAVSPMPFLGGTIGQRTASIEFVTYPVSIEVSPSGGKSVETETQEWDTVAMRQTKTRRQRTVENFSQAIYTYDAWGNIKTLDESTQVGTRKTNKLTTTRYFNMGESDLSQGLPGLPTMVDFAVGSNQKSLPATRITKVKGWRSDDTSVGLVENESRQAYTYNTQGQLTVTRDWSSDDSSWISTSYDYRLGTGEDGQLKSVTGPTGQITSYDYDYTPVKTYSLTTTQQQVSIDTQGTKQDLVTVNTYRRLTGTLVAAKDPRGFTINKQYDELDRVTYSYEPTKESNLGSVPFTHIVYNDSLLGPSSIVTSLSKGNTTYQFDPMGRLTSVVKTNTKLPSTDLETVTTMLEYDGWDQVSKMRGPVSNRESQNERSLITLATSFNYDYRGRVTSVWAPGAIRAKTSAYDDTINLVTTTDETLRVTRQTLDWNGQALEQSVKNGVDWLTTRTYYDAAGRPLAQYDAKNAVISISYNSLGRESIVDAPVRTVNQQSVTPRTLKTYYPDGSLKTLTKKVVASGGEVETTKTTIKVNGLGQTLETTTPVTVGTALQTLVTRTIYRDGGLKTHQTTGYLEGEFRGTTWTYDQRGRVKTEVDDLGQSTGYQYDDSGNRTKITDPRGFFMDLRYDQLGRLFEGDLPTTTGGKPKIGFVYDGRGNLVSRTEPDGRMTSYTYTLRNQVETQTLEKAGQKLVTSYRYDDAGRLKSTTYPNGRVDLIEYDWAGRISRQGNDSAGWTSFDYDANSHPIKVTNGRNFSTITDYDIDQRPYRVTDPLGQVTTTEFDAWGLVTKTTDPEGNTRSYQYDQIGRPVKETTPWNSQNSARYDAWGYVVSSTDGRGSTTSRHYRADNRLDTESVTGGSPTITTSFDYDPAGDLKKQIQDNVTTTYNTVGGTYQADPYNLVRYQTQTVAGTQPFVAPTLTMTYDYDLSQRLTTVTNPQGPATTYRYNDLGQIAGMSGWVTGDLHYDQTTGLLKDYTLANQVAKNLAYDDQGRVSDLGYKSSAGVLKEYSLTYDKAGNIETKNDNQYAYDKTNQLVGANQRGWFQKSPESLSPQYALADRDYYGTSVKLISLKNSDTVSLDMASRTIAIDLGGIYGVNRLELKPQSTQTRVRARDLRLYSKAKSSDPWTPILSWSLDTATDGTLKITFETIAEVQFLKFGTIWDDRNEANESIDTEATFKNLVGQLIKVWTLSKTRLETYEYDKAGGRRSLSVDGKTSEYKYYLNSANGHLPWLASSGDWYYQYDANGNLVTKAKALVGVTSSNVTALSSNTAVVDKTQEYWTYAWDLKNRLSSVKKNNVQVVSYTYNADNLRVAKTKGSETTVYAYGRNGALTYQKNLSTGTARSYFYLENQVVGWIDIAADDKQTTYYASTDTLGSVTAITDKNAKVVWSSEYDPFGKTAGAEGMYDFDGSYAGHEPDRDTGLIYMWNRWQDPETGRFISEDPARDGENWYAYVGNNPINSLDPTGLISLKGSDGTTIDTGGNRQIPGSPKAVMIVIRQPESYNPSRNRDSPTNAAKDTIIITNLATGESKTINKVQTVSNYPTTDKDKKPVGDFSGNTISSEQNFALKVGAVSTVSAGEKSVFVKGMTVDGRQIQSDGTTVDDKARWLQHSNTKFGTSKDYQTPYSQGCFIPANGSDNDDLYATYQSWGIKKGDVIPGTVFNAPSPAPTIPQPTLPPSPRRTPTPSGTGSNSGGSPASTSSGSSTEYGTTAYYKGLYGA